MDKKWKFLRLEAIEKGIERLGQFSPYSKFFEYCIDYFNRFLIKIEIEDGDKLENVNQITDYFYDADIDLDL